MGQVNCPVIKELKVSGSVPTSETIVHCFAFQACSVSLTATEGIEQKIT